MLESKKKNSYSTGLHKPRKRLMWINIPGHTLQTNADPAAIYKGSHMFTANTERHLPIKLSFMSNSISFICSVEVVVEVMPVRHPSIMDSKVNNLLWKCYFSRTEWNDTQVKVFKCVLLLWVSWYKTKWTKAPLSRFSSCSSLTFSISNIYFLCRLVIRV